MKFEPTKMLNFSTASTNDKINFAKKIVNHFKQNGFLSLTNTYVTIETQKELFAEMEYFFNNLDIDTKKAINFNSKTNRGLASIGGEALDENSIDIKETYNMGFEDTTIPNLFPNPSKFPNFQKNMLKYMHLCYKNVQDLLRAIALGCDMPEEFFVEKHNENSQTFRLLHYPVVKDSKEPYAVSPHTDYGSLTMVLQDHELGLSVQDLKTKEWHEIKGELGSAVINIGDLMMRWSNDVLKSNPHKADYIETKKSRYMTAFFAHPSYQETISCLPTFKGEKELYESINSLDYLNFRIKNTYKV